MKKQLFILLSLLACLIVLSSHVYAACSTTKCEGKIERLYITDGLLYIGTDGDETNLNCSAVAGVYITLPVSNPDFKNYYAMMLTSMSLGNQIGLRIVDLSGGCKLSYAYIDN